jgi:hypothetical protein
MTKGGIPLFEKEGLGERIWAIVTSGRAGGMKNNEPLKAD